MRDDSEYPNKFLPCHLIKLSSHFQMQPTTFRNQAADFVKAGLPVVTQFVVTFIINISLSYDIGCSVKQGKRFGAFTLSKECTLQIRVLFRMDRFQGI